MEEAPNQKNKEGDRYDASYLEFIKHETDVENILKEIEEVFASHASQEEAERIICEELGNKMTVALEKSKEALEKWLKELRKMD